MLPLLMSSCACYNFDLILYWFYNVCVHTDPAVFQTCSGDGNMNIPQKGCSERESLTTQEGQQVMFNIALTHQGPEENCHNQTIQSIEFRRDDGSSNFTIMCFSGSCNPEQSPRLNVLRTSKFNITITLSGLMQNDSGRYTALADIRRPSNNMRVCIYKNFSLNVLESTSKSSSILNLMLIHTFSFSLSSPPPLSLSFP